MLWNGTPKFDYQPIGVDSPMVESMILTKKNTIGDNDTVRHKSEESGQLAAWRQREGEKKADKYVMMQPLGVQ